MFSLKFLSSNENFSKSTGHWFINVCGFTGMDKEGKSGGVLKDLLIQP